LKELPEIRAAEKHHVTVLEISTIDKHLVIVAEVVAVVDIVDEFVVVVLKLLMLHL